MRRSCQRANGRIRTTFIGGAAYLMGEALRPAAKRWEYGYPVDMRAQFGLPTASGEDEDE